MADPQDAKNERALRRLLRGLMRELFQTETSAVQHCRREAERLSEAPPARTLHEISSQAASFLKELPHVAAAHDLPKSAGGMMIGALFSEARDKVVDRLIRTERSYRGTLLGVRHGIDLVQLLAQTAHEAGYTELYLFCERWLAARQRLVASLEREMVWFAKQPAEAMRFAR